MIRNHQGPLFNFLRWNYTFKDLITKLKYALPNPLDLKHSI